MFLNFPITTIMEFRFKYFLLSLFLLFFCNFVFADYEEILNKAGKVVFANILYRHGARTPEDPCPLDPYKNESYWPMGFGQLTNLGKKQHFELGKWLRKRYIDLIPDGKYSPKVIFVQSTDMDRTLMSAMANLAGMFPPEENQLWSDLLWQPIPVHTVPEHLDKVLAMGHPCPKYEKEYNIFLNSKFMKDFNAKYKELFYYLSKNSGAQIDNPKTTEYLFSDLTIEKMNNYTLPNWTKSVYPEKMHPVASFSFAMRTFNKKLQRLRYGPLLKEMIQHMEDKRTGKLVPDRSLWVYSAHDTTVAGLLNTLGVFELHTPPFIATVLLELHKSLENEYSVVVWYKNTTAEPSLLTIPGCDSACPLEKFVSLLQDVIPLDWDSECHSHQFFDLTSDQPYNSLAIFEKAKVLKSGKYFPSDMQ